MRSAVTFSLQSEPALDYELPSAPGGRLTTIVRQFARKPAETANATERKIRSKSFDSTSEIGYFSRFVRDPDFARFLLRM